MARLLQNTAGQIESFTPISASAGATDAAKAIQTDATGKIDATLLPAAAGTGENYNRIASEALAAGDLINVWSNAGVANIRKADATIAGKEAMGFVQSSVASGATGVSRIGNGVITGLVGLTIGATYYLSTTAGGIVTVAPSAVGNVIQKVGRAISATELAYVDDNSTIVVAA